MIRPIAGNKLVRLLSIFPVEQAVQRGSTGRLKSKGDGLALMCAYCAELQNKSAEIRIFR
jgi:hypothetical protein